MIKLDIFDHLYPGQTLTRDDMEMIRNWLGDVLLHIEAVGLAAGYPMPPQNVSVSLTEYLAGLRDELSKPVVTVAGRTRSDLADFGYNIDALDDNALYDINAKVDELKYGDFGEKLHGILVAFYPQALVEEGDDDA